MNVAARLATGALLLLPGALTVYFSFNAGGFFPASVAFAAIVLAAALALRIALAESPFAGFGVPLAIAVVAFALFAAWTWLSGRWGQHAPGRSLIEFDRALLYLIALVLLGSLPRVSANVRWMVRGLALGITVVGITGLATRVLPNVFPTADTIANDRLSYPVTYWNALGVIAVVGVILCFHLASTRSEPPWARVLGAAAVPALATTVFFTFSRGAIAAGIVGLVAYVVAGRPRALVSGVLATVPAATVSVVAAYHADLLATDNPTSSAATAQGHDVAIVVGICVAGAALLRLALLALDARFPREGMFRALPRRPILAGAAAAAAAAVALLIVLGVPGTIGDQYDQFVNNKSSGVTGGDLRTRFTNPTNNGRIDTWDAAIDDFRERPLAGSGAGTYQNVWAINRKIPLSVQDAHSLYAEVLGELGIVGLLLLLVAMVTMLGTVASRARGPDRTLYAAIFAVMLIWAIHAGVDWDWEMPAVTAPVFALGGAALASGGRGRALRPPGTIVRIAAVVACLAVAVVPGLVLASQTRLDDSGDAFQRGDCATAVSDASDAISVLGVRAEPYEVRGYCRAQHGAPREAVQDFQKALARDPANWIYHYDLAVALAAAGDDPSARALAAYRHNPLSVDTRDLARRLGNKNKRRWRREARKLLRGAAPFYLSTR